MTMADRASVSDATHGNHAGIGTPIFRTPSNAFSVKIPKVPCHLFEEERLAALDEATPAGAIVLDLSARLGLAYPATTPSLLARYLILDDNSDVELSTNATGEMYYVASGHGVSSTGDLGLEWQAGDVFCMPGGGTTTHRAGNGRALLLQCTDEPMLNFLGVRPRDPADGVIKPTLYRGSEIDLILKDVHSRAGADVAGKAVFCTTPVGEATSTVTPMMVGVINTLEAGGDQRAHRHNAVALTFCIQGEGCHSIIEGQRVDWRKFGVMVTPPTEAHSHHNRGQVLMRSFVMQDSGLYYHTRAVGFAYCE
jgi:gentisate 1,2-dioxygenase